MLRTPDLKTISLKATLFAEHAIQKVIGYDPEMVIPISKAITSAAFSDREFRQALLGEKTVGLPNIPELIIQAIRLAREVAREMEVNIYKQNVFIGDFAAMYITEAIKQPLTYLTLLDWRAKPESTWPLEKYDPEIII